MGLPKLKTKISVEAYLEGEKFSPVRHEYIVGEVYAKAGTSNNHSRISNNLRTALSKPITKIYRRVRFEKNANTDNNE